MGKYYIKIAKHSLNNDFAHFYFFIEDTDFYQNNAQIWITEQLKNGCIYKIFQDGNELEVGISYTQGNEQKEHKIKILSDSQIISKKIRMEPYDGEYSVILAHLDTEPLSVFPDDLEEILWRLEDKHAENFHIENQFLAHHNNPGVLQKLSAVMEQQCGFSLLMGLVRHRAFVRFAFGFEQLLPQYFLITKSQNIVRHCLFPIMRNMPQQRFVWSNKNHLQINLRYTLFDIETLYKESPLCQSSVSVLPTGEIQAIE